MDLFGLLLGFLNGINSYSGALTFFATLFLVIVTVVYVIITNKILESSKQQMGLLQNPVIGIQIDNMGIFYDPTKELHGFSVEISIVNLGSAPALEIYQDAEIRLKYSNIGGENILPQEFGLSFYPFLRVDSKSDNFGFTYWNEVANHLKQDFTKQYAKNAELLEKSQEPEYDAVTLCIFVYYKNNLNQHFKSYFETYIVNGTPLQPINLSADYDINIISINLPKQIFYAKPITKNEYENEITSRNLKREKLSKFFSVNRE
jgi:hypothetical protein